ncbi:hypothetical protein NECAME_08364 [Necator americanus]|uniref:Phlebovirus glycoprotein G2 fusion domain-containing protein n=1 Tax=Necator americanus TaxID=51031 RepID=W2TKG3_NECAM|nr:hypothetical protein NECAME_08364 [Necator americanus]ETN81661.1 hypothetical protein NECAME_08364 [Necator americanus]
MISLHLSIGSRSHQAPVIDIQLSHPLGFTLESEDPPYLPPIEAAVINTKRQAIAALEVSYKLTDKFWNTWQTQYLTALREKHTREVSHKKATIAAPHKAPGESTRPLELDDNGSSTKEISKKPKSKEQASTEPSQQRDQSDRDTPVLRTAQQPNNRYDLRPRRKINYTKEKEDTEPIARINKIMKASTILQVSLMLSLGVTILASKSEAIKETIRSIQCVPGGVHLISSNRIPYEVCAENYCVQFDNPRVDENISFPPDILHEHLVQWKFGEKLNIIKTLCLPSSFCLAMTCTFCSANIFNLECWPISAILGTATLLYFLITGCYVLLYAPLVAGKPIRIAAHILWATVRFLFDHCRRIRRRQTPDRSRQKLLAEIIAISLIAIIPATKQCQHINIFTHRSTICTNNGFGLCQIELSEVFRINPFKREACLKITLNET